MPRVLRIINRFNLGGPTFNAAYLSKYLEPEYETLLVGGIKDESEDSSEYILESLGIEPRYISNMKREVKFSDDRRAYAEIKKIIADFKPDIVHTHASKAGALGRRAAFSMKVPVTVHTFHGHVFHSYFNRLKTSIYKNLERNLAKKTTRIVAISEIQKKELTDIHKICDAKKIEVIPLGFDLSRFTSDQENKRVRFRQKYNIGAEEIALAITGRLVPIKNHKLFIDAVHAASQQTLTPLRAFIVGDGELRHELMSYCKNLDVSYTTQPGDKALIHFTSWIKEIDEVNAGCDVICLTSLNEGTPVTLIEAQASGKPIVSTNVGGIEDICLSNETALLSASNDVAAFTKNLLKIIDNPSERERLSLKGNAFALDRFDYTRLVSDMASLYERLLSEL